jgi:hypothetical protein
MNTFLEDQDRKNTERLQQAIDGGFVFRFFETEENPLDGTKRFNDCVHAFVPSRFLFNLMRLHGDNHEKILSHGDPSEADLEDYPELKEAFLKDLKEVWRKYLSSPAFLAGILTSERIFNDENFSINGGFIATARLSDGDNFDAAIQLADAWMSLKTEADRREHQAFPVVRVEDHDGKVVEQMLTGDERSDYWTFITSLAIVYFSEGHLYGLDQWEDTVNLHWKENKDRLLDDIAPLTADVVEALIVEDVGAQNV